MKKIKTLCIALALIMVVAALSGCGNATNQTAGETKQGNEQTVKGNKQVEIYMFIGSPEFKDPTQALCDEYMKQNPNVKIVFEASSNYGAEFQAKLTAGQIPDIFLSPTGIELGNYQEYAYDLSDQPLADALSPAAKASLSYGDKLCGFAQACDLFGLIYNMDILNECGITKMPETIDEFKAMCEAVAAKNYQVFTTGIGNGWPIKHMFQPFLNMTGEPAPETREKLASGEKHISDYPSLYNGFFDFIDTVVKYGGSKPLESTFDIEIAEMVSGKVACMVGQGSWAEGEILRGNENFKLGFAGYPVSNNPADCRVELGTSQAICVSKDSKVLQETLDFANWWNTSDYGKAWYADSIITYPPLTDAKFPTSALNTDAVKSITEKGAGPMSIYDIPMSVSDTYLPAAVQNYILGEISKDDACKQIEDKFAEFVTNN